MSSSDTTEADFCSEHQIAEADCPYCSPSIIQERGTCTEHGVAEALCYKCHPALVAAFKSVGDWCNEHDVPESQCGTCNPEFKRQLADQSADSGVPRIKRKPNPTCKNNDVAVKLSSYKTAKRAGIEYVTIEKRPIRDVITCNAEVEFARNLYARVASRVPAIVHQVKKDLGDPVKTGDTLAILDSVDLGIAKTEYLKFIATVKTGKENLEQAQSYYDRLNEMEIRLAGIDLIKARELLQVSIQNAAREDRLMKRQSGSEKSLMDARAELTMARAKTMASEKKLHLFGLDDEVIKALSWQSVDKIKGIGSTSAQAVFAARIELRNAEASLQASRRRLLTLGLTTSQIESVANEGDTSTLLALQAPFNGKIVELNAVAGEVVDTSKALFGIADTSQLWALIDVKTKDLRRVRDGQDIFMTIDGLRGERFAGVVDWVSSQVDSTTKTTKVRALLDNSSGYLRAEMFGQATIVVHDASEPVVMVPKEAVQWEGCCNVVFIRFTDTLYETRKVQLGLEADDIYVVEEGLDGGESVVTTGSFLLKTEILKGNIGAGCGCVDGK